MILNKQKKSKGIAKNLKDIKDGIFDTVYGAPYALGDYLARRLWFSNKKSDIF